MPSKRAAGEPPGGRQAWEAPAVGRTWNLTASRAPDAAALEPRLRGVGNRLRASSVRSGEVAVALSSVQAPEKGPSSLWGLGCAVVTRGRPGAPSAAQEAALHSAMMAKGLINPPPPRTIKKNVGVYLSPQGSGVGI